jgi:hypothetical protein
MAERTPLLNDRWATIQLDASPYSTSTEKTAPSCTLPRRQKDGAPEARRRITARSRCCGTARGGFVGRKGQQVVALGRNKRPAPGHNKGTFSKTLPGRI